MPLCLVRLRWLPYAEPKLVEKVTVSFQHLKCEFSEANKTGDDSQRAQRNLATARSGPISTIRAPLRNCFNSVGLPLNGQRSAHAIVFIYVFWMEIYTHTRMLKMQRAINHLEFPFGECRKEEYIRKEYIKEAGTTWAALYVIAVFRPFESSTKRAFYTSDEKL